MRAEVIAEFVDKHTGQLHPVGEVLNIGKARYEEIMQAVEFVRPASGARKHKQEVISDGHEDSGSDGG